MIIGVGGASCSGKSTLCSWLHYLLDDSQILRQDAFYKSDSLIPVVDGITNWDSPQALEIVRANIAACDCADTCTVVRSEAAAHLMRNQTAYDLVLLDPPYEFDSWDELLSGIDAQTLVIESNRAIEAPAGSQVLRERRYGGTVVTVMAPILAVAIERPPSEEHS